MRGYPRALLLSVLVALVLSGVAPYDRTTWWLEVFPILVGALVLIATRRRFPLTHLTYTLLAVHALILMVGGHYTYARVPLGFWAEHAFGFTRNDHDRLGHFVQGFVPAIVVREILLRTSPLRRGRWLFVLVTAVCLAISACYELFEWWVALAGGQSAERSSARKAMCGIRNRTCSWPCSARSSLSFFWARSMTAHWRRCTRRRGRPLPNMRLSAGGAGCKGRIVVCESPSCAPQLKRGPLGRPATLRCSPAFIGTSWIP